MRKQVLSFLLMAAMLFVALPAEVSATVSPDEASGRGYAYKGGLQMESIEISDEAAEEIGTVSAEDLGANGELQYYSGVYGSQAYSSFWDEYSSNYIYNRLDSKERKLWDLMDAECRKYLTTAAVARQEKISSRNTVRTFYVTQGMEFESLEMTYQSASNVYLLFTYANPQYYFLDSSTHLHTSKSLFPVMYDKFANGTARQSETRKLQTQINSMKAEVDKGTTDLEKARIAHDLIIRKVKYDDAYDSGRPNTLYHQSAYSVFCDSYTVCAGYTKAFELLMNSEGIDTIGVTSLNITVDRYGNETSDGHAWNAVCLNDMWYYVDCTWDDLDGGWENDFRELRYTWFGVSEATLTGPMDRNNYHRAEAFYSGMLPKCNRDLGSTEDTVGTAYVPVQMTEAPRITQRRTADGMRVTLTTSTPGAEIYYTTDGKAPSPSFSRGYYYTGAFTINADVTLRAIAVCDGRKNSTVTSEQVKGKQYAVKFNTMGGSKVTSQKAWPGEVSSQPDSPKRKGYVFAGWYSDKNCTVKWGAGGQITKDMTVYAKWTKVKVKATSVSKLKGRPGRRVDVTVRRVKDAKGYQIRYSVKPSMKSAKKVTVSSNKRTISGLRKGSKYYVQVRAYKLDSMKQKVYGKWSNSRTVVIRK